MQVEMRGMRRARDETHQDETLLHATHVLEHARHVLEHAQA